MITFKQGGNFKNTDTFLKNAANKKYLSILDKYGQEGVIALASATPTASGVTSNSWGYQIVTTKTTSKIVWTNSNVVDGCPIAIILQYGHATGSGGYVQGIDYINPAIKPIFDNLAENAWQEVINT